MPGVPGLQGLLEASARAHRVATSSVVSKRFLLPLLAGGVCYFVLLRLLDEYWLEQLQPLLVGGVAEHDHPATGQKTRFCRFRGVWPEYAVEVDLIYRGAEVSCGGYLAAPAARCCDHGRQPIHFFRIYMTLFSPRDAHH